MLSGCQPIPKDSLIPRRMSSGSGSQTRGCIRVHQRLVKTQMAGPPPSPAFLPWDVVGGARGCAHLTNAPLMVLPVWKQGFENQVPSHKERPQEVNHQGASDTYECLFPA